jgi:hypothetical protein
MQQSRMQEPLPTSNDGAAKEADRFGRSNSTTSSENSSRCRLKPAPGPPVPSIAQARIIGYLLANSTSPNIRFGIARGCRRHGDLAEDTTGHAVDDGCGVGMHVSVDADDNIDQLTQIGQTGHAFSPSPDGTWFRSGTKDRQDCDETHPAPLTPGGQTPNQASSTNRAGAGDRERTSRSKAQDASPSEGHPQSPTHSPPPSGCESDPHRRFHREAAVPASR